MYCLICIYNRSLHDVTIFPSFAEAKSQMTYEFYYRLREFYGTEVMGKEEFENEYGLSEAEAWMGQTGDEDVLDWYITEIVPSCVHGLSTGNVVNYYPVYCPKKNAFVSSDCGQGAMFRAA